MLNILPVDERIITLHRAKLAYVYIRQSTPGQIRHHQESTTLEYRLVERALTLGWPKERVTVIDEDLGKSGAESHLRSGFQRLIAKVGLGHAGLVLSFDASRLTRKNSDWHQLLQLCSMFGVLIAGSERLYPRGSILNATQHRIARISRGLSVALRPDILPSIPRTPFMHGGVKIGMSHGASPVAVMASSKIRLLRISRLML